MKCLAREDHSGHRKNYLSGSTNPTWTSLVSVLINHPSRARPGYSTYCSSVVILMSLTISQVRGSSTSICSLLTLSISLIVEASNDGE
jgi:hypothetical protein